MEGQVLGRDDRTIEVSQNVVLNPHNAYLGPCNELTPFRGLYCPPKNGTKATQAQRWPSERNIPGNKQSYSGRWATMRHCLSISGQNLMFR